MIYSIVSDYDVFHLVTLVNMLIQQGWKPLGGVSSSMSIKHYASKSTVYEPFFHQTMVKEGEDKEISAADFTGENNE
jgi:hypothetical protein